MFTRRARSGVATAIALAVALFLGGCSSARAPSRSSVVIGRANLSFGYAANGSLYLATGRQANDPTLLRVDRRSLRVAARRDLGADISAMLLAGGSLWVETANFPTRSAPAPVGRLWRLDPKSLVTRSNTELGRWPTSGDGGGLAVAGGRLWVAGADALERVSLASARVTRVVPIGAVGLDVAASPDGGTLLLSAGNSGSRIERRDPRTGTLIASSPLIDGVINPRIGGIVGGEAWFSEPTGMMGYVSKLDLRTMRYAIGGEGHPGVLGDVTTTNGVRVDVIDGIVWISQFAGGRQSNYCADPRTARPRAVLAVGPQAMFLTADDRNVYTSELFAHGFRLSRASIDPRCR